VSPDPDGASGQTNLVFDSVASEDYQFRHIYLLRTPVGRVAAGVAGRPNRASEPETADSNRSLRRFIQVVGGFSVTVSSLLNIPAGSVSTVSSVDDDSVVTGAVSGAVSGVMKSAVDQVVRGAVKAAAGVKRPAVAKRRAIQTRWRLRRP
jgi:hypothetical protein